MMILLFLNVLFAKEISCLDANYLIKTALVSHIKHQSLNDEILEKSFNNALNYIDPLEILFTLEDVEDLKKEFEKDKTKLMNQLKIRNCGFFEKIHTHASSKEKETIKKLEELYKTEITKAQIKGRVKKEIHDEKIKVILFELKERNQSLELLKESIRDRMSLGLMTAKSVLNSLDEYTDFTVSERLDEILSGERDLIGITYDLTIDGLKISEIQKGSPADGVLKEGDLIIEIDGKSIKNSSMKRIDDIFKGSTHKLKYVRNGKEKITTLKKKRIRVQQVNSEIINTNGKKIMVLNIPSFYHNYEKKEGSAHHVWQEYVKNRDIDGMVINLLDNYGGYLDDCVRMAGLFLEEDVVLYSKAKDSFLNKDYITMYKKRSDNKIIKTPVVILMSNSTASAAEIFASALKDHGRAILVGSENTYGKGLVQGVIQKPIDLGFGILKISQASYYSPNGKSRQGNPLKSDIQVLKESERRDKNSLKFDDLVVEHTQKNIKEISLLKEKSKERVKALLTSHKAVVKEGVNIMVDYLNLLESDQPIALPQER